MLQRGAELVWNIVFRSRPVLLALMMISGTSVATALTVTTTNDGGAGSLRQAIADAVSGDQISFSLPPNSSITLTTGHLSINKSLTIVGPGADQLTVRRSSADGTPGFRIFTITGNISVTVVGLTIANGLDNNATTGGGISVGSGSSVALFQSTITGNTSLATAGPVRGGGIYNAGTLTVASSTISGNRAYFSNEGYGGGIYNNGTLTVTNSTIVGNSCDFSGGGLFNTGTANISNTTISGNGKLGPQPKGGGVSNEGTLTMINSTVADNVATYVGGGGIFSGSGTLNVKNTIIAMNSAEHSPDVAGTLVSHGYILIAEPSGSTITTGGSGTFDGMQLNVDPLLGPLQHNGGPTQTHALLSGSPAIDKGNSSGSGVDQRDLPRPVDDPGFANASGGDGADIGAYEVQADQLPGCNAINRVVNNNNESGADSLRGVIANVCAGSTITFAQNVRGAITLTNGELMINKSLTINGPGANLLSVRRSSAAGTPQFRIINIPDNFNVTINGLTIANGKVSGIFNPGGGILNGGRLTLTNGAVSGNSAEFGGGGITNVGTLRISDSTISGNDGGTGGGISSNTGTLTLTNTTVSGNSADDGAGIAGRDVTITNSTIAGNSASGSGGGLSKSSGTLRARNTIIALNTAPTGPDVNGALTSDGFNLIGNGAGAQISPAESDQIGTPGSPIDPLLDSLRDNGGPTLTRALLSGSRAIDKGESSGSVTDQRGFSRPSDHPGITNASGGNGGDIGAFEVQAAVPTPTPTPTPTSAPTRLANISTRLRVETDDNALIAGIIITGPEPKKVMLRGIGPSLPFLDRLENPTLELRNASGTLLDANDNWGESPDRQAIIDSTLPPGNDSESAIIATLPAEGASYTAILRGANNGTGIGVVEVYDLGLGANSKLANISTRGFVETEDNVMIAGTIVVGPGSQRVMIRALGPSLPVLGAVADPVLELRDANGVALRITDDWRNGGQEAEIIATTIPPANDLEAAIIYTLQGNGASYTAIVRGIGGSTGIAVVEIYALQ
jgi:hypothetical protein